MEETEQIMSPFAKDLQSLFASEESNANACDDNSNRKKKSYVGSYSDDESDDTETEKYKRYCEKHDDTCDWRWNGPFRREVGVRVFACDEEVFDGGHDDADDEEEDPVASITREPDLRAVITTHFDNRSSLEAVKLSLSIAREAVLSSKGYLAPGVVRGDPEDEMEDGKTSYSYPHATPLNTNHTVVAAGGGMIGPKKLNHNEPEPILAMGDVIRFRWEEPVSWSVGIVERRSRRTEIPKNLPTMNDSYVVAFAEDDRRSCTLHNTYGGGPLCETSIPIPPGEEKKYKGLELAKVSTRGIGYCWSRPSDLFGFLALPLKVLRKMLIGAVVRQSTLLGGLIKGVIRGSVGSIDSFSSVRWVVEVTNRVKVDEMDWVQYEDLEEEYQISDDSNIDYSITGGLQFIEYTTREIADIVVFDTEMDGEDGDLGENDASNANFPNNLDKPTETDGGLPKDMGMDYPTAILNLTGGPPPPDTKRRIRGRGRHRRRYEQKSTAYFTTFWKGQPSLSTANKNNSENISGSITSKNITTTTTTSNKKNDAKGNRPGNGGGERVPRGSSATAQAWLAVPPTEARAAGEEPRRKNRLLELREEEERINRGLKSLIKQGGGGKDRTPTSRSPSPKSKPKPKQKANNQPPSRSSSPKPKPKQKANNQPPSRSSSPKPKPKQKPNQVEKESSQGTEREEMAPAKRGDNITFYFDEGKMNGVVTGQKGKGKNIYMRVKWSDGDTKTMVQLSAERRRPMGSNIAKGEWCMVDCKKRKR